MRKSSNGILSNEEQHEQEIDAMLAEISKYKTQSLEYRNELRGLRNKEVKQQKTIETLLTENEKLTHEVNALDQKVRELEIQLSLPTNERTLQINQETPVFQKPLQRDTFRAPRLRRRSDIKKSRKVYAIVAGACIGLVVLIAKIWSNQTPSTPNNIPVNNLTNTALQNNVPNNAGVTTIPAGTPTTAPMATTAVEEGYLLIENPIEKDNSVRVRDGFNARARELAWVNPGEKFRIRAQSPQKMKRTFTINGQTYTIEDYFYKISDKEQWVFGFFTTKRTAPAPNNAAAAAPVQNPQQPTQ